MMFDWTGGSFHREGDNQRKAWPEFKEIPRKGNVGKKTYWKLPSGYKGAFEKARGRCRRSQPKGRIEEFFGMASEDQSHSDIEFHMGKIHASIAVWTVKQVRTVKSQVQ